MASGRGRIACAVRPSGAAGSLTTTKVIEHVEHVRNRTPDQERLQAWPLS